MGVTAHKKARIAGNYFSPCKDLETCTLRERLLASFSPRRNWPVTSRIHRLHDRTEMGDISLLMFETHEMEN